MTNGMNRGGPATDPSGEFVTFKAGGQLFGLPIHDVHEVFVVTRLTPVPLAPAMIKGLLNLRGRIVTALCMRTVMGLPEAPETAERMAIGFDIDGEPFALLIDEIGDVMCLSAATHEAKPVHLDQKWQSLSNGVHRLETSILVVLSLEHLITGHCLAA